MKKIASVLLAVALCGFVSAADAPRAFPLWDGKETIDCYAARVNMPATKSIDLGGGVRLDLVLIPAGQFIMGSAEPAKPSATETEAIWLIVLGGSMTAFLSLVLLIKCTKQKKFSFSLRWLLLMTISIGLCVGGIARRSLALKEAARYEREMAEFNTLPDNEKPAHLVTHTQPFYMGKYTVTLEQYCVLMNVYTLNLSSAQLPVSQVSWNHATEFCKKLTDKLDNHALEARLPTEAQWEYACRAGTRTRFYSGDLDSELDAVAWYAANSGNMTHPVGQKKPNSFGLYDMHGNVLQWCEDLYVNHYEANEASDPVNTKIEYRVFRGGCWRLPSLDCRSAYRGTMYPVAKNSYIGFRVVVTSSSTPP